MRVTAEGRNFLILSICTMSVPTPVIMHPKLAFLVTPEGMTLMRRVMDDRRDDLALASSDWMRALPVWQRTALLEQRGLRIRGLRKQTRAAEMLFTPLGLQQMTTDEIARYKASRLPDGIRTIADLCCGPGGDSLPLPSDIRVFGVDRDSEALRAYRHNLSVHRPTCSPDAVLADVTRFEARPGTLDGIFLDPARRAIEDTHRDRDFDTEPEPGWAALTALARKFGNAVLKLGPGTRLPEELAEEECEYIGLRDECLELSVRTGSFGRPGWVRAVELPSGAVVEATVADREDSFGNVQEPGAWFYEPVKSVVRSHLFGIVAARHGLWQLDARTAYLSGSEAVDSPLLKRYRVVKILPVDERVLRAELAAEDIGTVEIKKRGLDIVPEEWRKKLKPKGAHATTLVFTRIEGKPAVLRVEKQ